MVILACEKCPRSKGCDTAKPKGPVPRCRDPSHAEIHRNRLSTGKDAWMPPFEGMSKLERTPLRAAGAELYSSNPLRFFKASMKLGLFGLREPRDFWPQATRPSKDFQLSLWTLDSAPRLKSCFARFRERNKRHPCGVASTPQCHRNYTEPCRQTSLYRWESGTTSRAPVQRRLLVNRNSKDAFSRQQGACFFFRFAAIGGL